MKSLIHKLAKERLDPTKSFRSQDKKKLMRIYEIVSTVHFQWLKIRLLVLLKASKEFSFLRDYENHWPIRDMLISRLKYTSESARRKEAQKKTKQMEKILTRSNGNISSIE